MAEIYWRWHQHEAPPFSADNAWSATWGSEFTPDGDRYRPPAGLYDLCEPCQDETGSCGHDDEGECEHCECPGWASCDRGYSCCDSAEELIAYFAARYVTAEEMDRDGVVYAFEGDVHGAGIEGEPLVEPTRVLKTLTWTELVEQAKESA